MMACQDRTTMTRLWGRRVVNRSRTAGTGTRRDRIGGQDRRDRTDRTGQIGGQQGWDNHGRTVLV